MRHTTHPHAQIVGHTGLVSESAEVCKCGAVFRPSSDSRCQKSLQEVGREATRAVAADHGMVPHEFSRVYGRGCAPTVRALARVEPGMLQGRLAPWTAEARLQLDFYSPHISDCFSMQIAEVRLLDSILQVHQRRVQPQRCQAPPSEWEVTKRIHLAKPFFVFLICTMHPHWFCEAVGS